MPVTPEDFAALLQREMTRYNPGGDTEGGRRDQAVRSANIAAGRGNSTALQRQAAAAPAAAAPQALPAETAAVPEARPTVADLFVKPEFPHYFGEQPPPQQFPDVWGVQPEQPQFMPPGFPAVYGEQPQPPPFVPPQFPPIYGEQPPVEEDPRTRFPIELRHFFR